MQLGNGIYNIYNK